MNEKMETVARSIGGVIWNVFPERYLCRVFGNNISDRDIVLNILFECCKYAYDNYEGEPTEILGTHSLRYYLQRKGEIIDGMDDDAERMVIQRTIKKINDWKRKKAEYLSLYIGADAEIFNPPEMNSAADKFSGYKFTPIQYWEVEDYYTTKLESAIIERRIANKNFKYDRFKDYIAEYDSNLLKEKSIWKDNDESTVISTLKAFLLEWSYPISFLYNVADEMERNNIKNVSAILDLQAKMSLFCGYVQVVSDVTRYDYRQGWDVFTTQSRLLNIRNRFINSFVMEPNAIDSDEMYSYKESIYIVSSILYRMTYQGVNIREWFKDNTGIDDWASVFREYDIFSLTPNAKEWSRKKVNIIKNILLRDDTVLE